MCRSYLSSLTACFVVGLAAVAVAAPCVVPDDGAGTITLPPMGCAYDGDVIVLTGGLPAGTTIEMIPKMHDFVCGSVLCTLGLPSGVCEGPGGSLGGDGQCFQAGIELQISGTGLLAGFNRVITLPIDAESHSGPRVLGDAVQSFPHDIMMLQGEIFGDPDFDIFKMTAGGDFGLPSPGHTTLTRLGPPGSDFQVDSFFDITYRIEFQGAPGSVLEGFGGATNGTSRFVTGDGLQTEDCCMQDGSCGPVPAGTCVANGGVIPTGGVCLGDNNGNNIDDACEQVDMEDCCLPNGMCAPVVAGTCTSIGGSIPAGGVCLGDGNSNGIDDACEPQEEEDCCFQDGSCGPVIVGRCEALGGSLPPGGFCLGDGNSNGIDDACEPQEKENCCFSDGSCSPVIIGSCVALGGFLPPGGFCLGDGNLNGVDDACELVEPNPFQIEFSLDIGSDKGLSDPFVDGDEGFDPGDVYLWMSGPVTPPLVPGGRDGFKDDAFIFGSDPYPDPSDFAMPPATAVPVGAGGPSLYNDYFDLDGHDQLDFNLEQYIPPTAPLFDPIGQDLIGNSFCVYPPEFLMISYDDDMAPGWPAGDVPVTAPSPAGVSSYGSTAGRDEVISINLAMVMPPTTIVSSYPLMPEALVHANLAPNPFAGGDKEDDDVDSLDIVEDPEFCQYWYFTADHEASLGLDPGSIYLAIGGFPALVVDQVVHLGLVDDPATPIIEDADVDAFEFTWIPVVGGPLSLAVLFSVDEDDPLTPSVDESGGLDPNMIYASFMTGSYFPMLVASDRPIDDVDALTIWREEPTALLPDCVPSDVNCDGNTDAGDILVVRGGANWNQSPPANPRADVNGSGTADAGDILIIRGGAVWNTSTGPCNCP